jgi:serine/threonine protein kinase
VPVVGAWTWNAARGFGIVSEIDAAEAFESLRTLERIFGVLLALLTLAGGTTVVGSLLAQRARRRAASAETQARHMGEYVIERRIGGGPMSDVYLARHAVLRRPTALKLLRLQDGNHSSLERFEREVRVTASLVHPNTIAIYDYGRSEDGDFFYAMEYLEGMDLDQFVSRFGPCPDARAIHLLRQACGSLGEAHARGLIHRDIKPANLFVCRGGAIPDLVKVLDFGLVRIADGETVSGSGVVVGTPLAMAPELFESADNASVRSDIYAIGCVGYALVTGQPVFEGASLAQLCNAHLSKRPVPPSQRLGRTVDAGLERLLTSCLAKDPRDRPQSIQELETLLARCPAAGGWTTAAAAAFWASRGDSFVDIGVHEKIA